MNKGAWELRGDKLVQSNVGVSHACVYHPLGGGFSTLLHSGTQPAMCYVCGATLRLVYYPVLVYRYYPSTGI